MSTSVTTTNLARSDVDQSTGSERAASPSTTWAVAGIGAAVAGLATVVLTGMVTPAYDKAISGNADKVMAALGDMRGLMTAFHVVNSVEALLLVVFGVGLYRRLRPVVPAQSLVPGVAAAGILLTAATQLLGSGLDTEFIEGVSRPDSFIGENAAFYNHWIGTIPYVWLAAGLSAGAIAVAAFRYRGIPRWMGILSLVLGCLVVVAGSSPQQYLAGMIAPLWLLVTCIGFVAGDRAHRR